jgi:hypothetical protein
VTATAEKTFEEPGPDLTDHQVAEGIRDGKYPSPTKYDAFWLFDLRITGTGMAWRDSRDEWAHRDPKEWLSDEFLQRCNGLAVVFIHPKGEGLNSEEFRERAIGNVVLPYIKGDEVWGISKIFDADAAKAMQTTHTSTSPGVKAPEGSASMVLNNGDKVLDEGLPRVMDHLAVCTLGVWDKDGPASGIRLDARKDDSVTEEEKKALEKERDDAKMELDAFKKADSARKDAEEKEKADKAKKDAAEKEEIEAAEKEKADKAKKDAADKKKDSRKDRHSKHDGDIMDCSRCDSEEAEEEKEREDKAKKDAGLPGGASPKTPVDAERGVEIKDSKDFQDALALIKRQGEQIAAMTAQPSIEDANEIAKAWTRWDSLYQMHGEQTPQAYPGEKPRAYLRRLADGQRKFTTSYQNYVFHDSQQVIDFGLVADQIFAESMAKAKAPPAPGTYSPEREIVTHPHGKTRTEFRGGDPWGAFEHPTSFFLKKINRPAGNVYGEN